MSSSADNANRDPQPNFWQGSWPAIVRIIIVEIVVLFALAAGLVYYLNWSSKAAMAEFMAASNAPEQAAEHYPRCSPRERI
jgi:flagellar basal body-associated protein FliL